CGVRCLRLVAHGQTTKPATPLGTESIVGIFALEYRSCLPIIAIVTSRSLSDPGNVSVEPKKRQFAPLVIDRLIAVTIDQYSTSKCYARSPPIWHYPKERIRNIINWPRHQLVRIVKTKPVYLSAGAEIVASLRRKFLHRATGMLNDFLRLCRIVEGSDSEGKTHQAEPNEGRPFQQHDRRRAGTEQAKTQHVDLPGHRIDSR